MMACEPDIRRGVPQGLLWKEVCVSFVFMSVYLPDEKIVLPARTSSFDLPHSALVGRAYQHGVRLERTPHDSLAGIRV